MVKIIKLSSNYAVCWALNDSSTGFCWALKPNKKPMLLVFRAQ